MDDKRTPPGSGAGPTKDASEGNLSLGIVAIWNVASKPARGAALVRWRPGDDDTIEPVDDEIDEGGDRGRS